MNKVLLITSSLILILGLFSCKEKMPESLSPETTKVEGNLGALFELVEGDYKLDDYSSEFRFDVKRNNKALIGFDKIGIGYEIYNGKGEVLISKKPALEDLHPLNYPSGIMTLKPGQIGSMSIYIEGWPDKLVGAKSFKLFLECNETEDDGIEVSSNNTSSNSWDSILDDYEAFVDKYIKLLEKAQSGDMSAITEYAESLEKAESLQSKLENSKSDLTSAQISRLNKIISKLSTAAM